MRIILMASLSYLLLSCSAVSAEAPSERAWSEMMDVCSTVIRDQSNAIMEGYPEAMVLPDLAPLTQQAVQHPDASVIAKAVYGGSQWFMCIVSGDPAVKTAENGALVAWITATLNHQIEDADDLTVVMEGVFAPVRVTCQDKGKFTATFAFPFDDGEFRIAATNTLPSAVGNPCLK
jgi:hypothetical protein